MEALRRYRRSKMEAGAEARDSRAATQNARIGQNDKRSEKRCSILRDESAISGVSCWRSDLRPQASGLRPQRSAVSTPTTSTPTSVLTASYIVVLTDTRGSLSDNPK